MDIECPFCGEQGFDLIGLKGHLMQYCEVYPVLETPSHQITRLILERKANL